MSMPPPPPPQPQPGQQPPVWQQPAVGIPPQPAWQQQGQWQTSGPVVEATSSPIAWVGVLGAVACVIGSFLTWAEVAGFEIKGLGGDDVGGTKDGALTLPLASAAAILLVIGVLRRKRVLHIIAAVCAGLAAAIAIYDISDINSQFDGNEGGFEVNIGEGLWMCAIGASVATICAIIAAVQTRKRPADPSRSVG